MSRTLKRPMFRMGGSTENSGIMDGMRQRYKDGADGIKITATGGVLSVAKSGENPCNLSSFLSFAITYV